MKNKKTRIYVKIIIAKNKYVLILIKKSLDNFSDKEKRTVNRQIRNLLENKFLQYLIFLLSISLLRLVYFTILFIIR